MGKKNSEASSGRPKRGRGGRGRGGSSSRNTNKRLDRISQDCRPDSAIDDVEAADPLENGSGE